MKALNADNCVCTLEKDIYMLADLCWLHTGQVYYSSECILLKVSEIYFLYEFE